ncbi:MAG TPA: Gfo/Idh/MocA family oxidoreductase [Bryobacteraceae bacterium]|nr:Gfo/Idh/MocA family oxidoreductase [Bryobacteraceae bacterium]
MIDRRNFIRAGAALTAASYARILGANDRIRVGAIGTGERCQYLLSLVNKIPGNDIVAVCDVYEPHRDYAKAKYAPDAQEYGDHRAVLDRKDIDAVVVGTPDHWHVPVTIDAVAAGKDVYCEKPVTHLLEEGDRLIAAVRDSKRVMQCGMQQRSWEHFREARDLIRSGRLGQVTFIRTYWYQNHLHAAEPADVDTSKLDWKRFLGSAPDRPFDADQYANWRWYWDFGGGAMTDLFLHWVDVAHWVMDSDTPLRATATGTRALLKMRQTPDTMSAALAYPNDVVVEFDSALLGYLEGGGLVFRGPKAMMRLWRGGYLVYDEVPRYTESPNSSSPVLEAKSTHDGALDHMRNFLDCVRSRNTPNAAVETGVAAARAGHVANFALRGNGAWQASPGAA